MKTLLRIDSSLRTERSYSRNMGDHFTNEWKKINPIGKVKHRDTRKNRIPTLDQATLECFYNESSQTDLLKFSDKLIAELFECDEFLITVPMYNFGIPSSLKCYFDLVVRSKKTFRYEEKLPIGLLKNKKVYIISSMGDIKTNTKSLVELHLQHILNYIGIDKIFFFAIDGTSDESYAAQKVENQKTEIINFLNQ